MLEVIGEPGRILIKENSEVMISIDKEKMVISGKEIFDRFFKDVTLDEKIEFDISGKERLEKEDTVIFDRFSELMNTVASAVNKLVPENLESR